MSDFQFDSGAGYSSTAGGGQATIVESGVVTTITIETSGTYEISALGAQGGGSGTLLGGLGASISGDVYLAAGAQLEIVVGGVGLYGAFAVPVTHATGGTSGGVSFTTAGTGGGGGGGGSFVFETNTGSAPADTILAIAGGGGGASNVVGGGGLTSAHGGAGGGGAAGGTADHPGLAGAGTLGGGGGGFAGGGSNSTGSTPLSGYASGPFSGGPGGIAISNPSIGTGGGGGTGGFGGGGGGGGGGEFSFTHGGGGGGGGWGGGGGGGLSGAGGGGGSYTAGLTNVTATGDAHSGSGQVQITFVSAACFVTGTLIRTARGEVPVEALQVGDLAVASSGDAHPIVWIGHRRVDRPTPEEKPVRVAAGAFGDRLPARHLWLSRGHAVCVSVLDEVFTPISRLINGTTIAEVEVDEVTYWHVELESHDVIFAEGLPSESYMDAGNRSWFGHEYGRLAEVDPERVAESLTRYARPFVDEGPVVEAMRKRLAARAEVLKRASMAA